MEDVEEGAMDFVQTPQPEFPVDWAQDIAVPEEEEFGDFTNNVESVQAALWNDGEESEIFTWAEDNYDEETANFGAPNGDVFELQVTFIDGVTTTWVCLDGGEDVLCASSEFTTLAITSEIEIGEDGSIVLEEVESEELSNDVAFGEDGAGIGLEFGHALDENVWSVWNYSDDETYSFTEGSYEVYVVQAGLEGNFVFSDTLDLVYNGA